MAPDTNQTDTSQTIPLIEERLHVATRAVETGRVRVTTSTEAHEEIARADLAISHVEVERIAIGRPVDTMPLVREEDGVLIVPVVEEVLVTEKRLMLVEEIRLVRHTHVQAIAQPVTLRRQRAVVERLATITDPQGE